MLLTDVVGKTVRAEEPLDENPRCCDVEVWGKNHEKSLGMKNPLANVVVMADECPGHVGAGRTGRDGGC